MQAKQTKVIFTIIICTILLGAFIYLMMPEVPEVNVPTADAIATSVLAGVNIPTAEDIANAIDLDVPVTRLSLRQDLKADAISVCNDEFNMDEVEDLYGDDDFVELVREYVDDRNYHSINLGIDNSDDRTVTVDRIYKVEVEPDMGDDFKNKVYVTCEVTSDDGDLEADLEYSL